ncbi:MAG: hypothetical protein ACJ71G_20045 [Nitrososphaeraceae archaeon]
MKDTLLHIIWAEDSWINYSIQDLDDPNRPFPYDKYNSWSAIDNYNFNCISKVNNYLRSLKPEDLYKPVSRIIPTTLNNAFLFLHCFIDHG